MSEFIRVGGVQKLQEGKFIVQVCIFGLVTVSLLPDATFHEHIHILKSIYRKPVSWMFMILRCSCRQLKIVFPKH